MIRILAHLCFFLSGFAALLYQVGWVKQLSSLMGNTIYTLTTILIAFMAGLALGSFLIRFTRGTKILAIPGYIVIEILIGCYGIAFLVIFQSFQDFYQDFFLDQTFSFQLEMLYQFLICGMVIFFPTLLMGATLPLLAEFLYRKDHSFTKDFGRLYAVNSYGAFCGTIACGYFLLPNIGYQKTVTIGATLNFVVAGLAFLIYKLMQADSSSETVEIPVKSLKQKEKLPFSMVGLLLFISGFLGMSLQVCWNRLLGITLGGSTYTFTMVAACIILGIALGSHLITHLASKMKITANHTILLVLLATLSSYFVSYGITFFPLFIGALNGFLNNFFGSGNIDSSTVLYKFIFSEIIKFVAIMITLLPTTSLLGGIFPLTTALYSMEKDTVRSRVGLAYFINMVGVILGTGLAGYYLLPVIGVEKTIRINLWVGCFTVYLLIHFSPGVRSGAPKWLFSISVLYLVLFIIWLSPFYNYHLLTSSYFYNRKALPTEDEMRLQGVGTYRDYITQQYRMLFCEEDSVGLITGHEHKTYGTRWFKVNGKVDGSTKKVKGGDLTDFQIIAAAGFLFKPDAKEVLTIGLGIGVTHALVLKFPVKLALVVEISESVARLAKNYFAEFNHKYWENKASKEVIQDGRQYLKLNSKQWDIIIVQPSNPWMSGVSSLFTLEFYETLKPRLKPEGLAVLWFHGYGLEEQSIRSVVKSMHQVFPNCLILKGKDSDIYFVGRVNKEPLQISEKKLKGVYPEQLKEILDVFYVKDLKELLSKYIFMDATQIKAFVEGAVPNTDDNMLLEFSAGLYYNAKMKTPKMGKRYKTQHNFREFFKD